MDQGANSAQPVAHAFVRAINRQDPDAIAAQMSPDHRFIDSLGNTVSGREAMRKVWAGYFQMVPDYTLAIDETVSSGPIVVLLGTAQGTVARGNELKAEDQWSTPVAIRAVIENGFVAEWRVYADNEPIRKLIAKA
jgi:ketosteroid isomerase-like protein